VHGKQLDDVLDKLALFLGRLVACGFEFPEQAADFLVIILNVTFDCSNPGVVVPGVSGRGRSAARQPGSRS
jgi:hypothetical protein